MLVSILVTTVCHSVHRGGMRGCSGGACVVALGGHAWLLQEGACVVALGGNAWLLRGGHV